MWLAASNLKEWFEVKGQKTGGRKRGSLNKKTIEAQAIARGYGKLAMDTLVKLCRDGTSDSIRLGASLALLDRGYGKPAQFIETKDATPLTDVTNLELARRVAYLLQVGAKEGGVGGDSAASGEERSDPNEIFLKNKPKELH